MSILLSRNEKLIAQAGYAHFFDLVYKNIEAQMLQKIRTIIRILPASRPEEFKNTQTSFIEVKNNPFYKELPW